MRNITQDDPRDRAAKMIEFIQPLLDPSNASLEATRKAMEFGMVCWNLAISTPGQEPEESAVDKLVDAMKPPTDAQRASLKDLLRFMARRHRELFPEEHARAAHNLRHD